MLRSMLVGLDGSAFSNSAVQLSISWARQFGALLAGLGIVDQPGICRQEPVPLGAGHYKSQRDRVRLADAGRRVEEILQAFAARCAAEGVSHILLKDIGMPEQQIVQESRMYDVTMLGQQTYFHFQTQDWPDETLRKVLRQISRPVVTVPESLPCGTSVLVAYDGSPHADRALQAFLSLGLQGSDPVHVLAIDAERSTAERLAEQAVQFLALHDIEAMPHSIGSKKWEDKVILDQVEVVDARLLVMGAYGRSLWQELAFGSVTTRVLAAGRVPLFLCH